MLTTAHRLSDAMTVAVYQCLTVVWVFFPLKELREVVCFFFFFPSFFPDSGLFPNDLLVDRNCRLLLCFAECFDVSTQLSSGDERLQKQLMGKIRTDLFCFQRKGLPVHQTEQGGVG